VNNRSIRRLVAVALVSTLLGAAACSDDDSDEGSAETTTTGGGEAVGALSEEAAVAATTTYADLVVAAYDDTITRATELQTAIEAFIADPTDDTLADAKGAWFLGREVYGLTEAFRFYDGPIDNPDDGPEGQINAWPLDEAYIDYVDGDAETGIINDVTGVPEITTEVLVAANEEGGESNISTGWHAIEFLLWGQDLSADSAGTRPLTDYTTSPVAERRATYLSLLAQLLVDDLTFVRDQWDPEEGAYRFEFLADPSQAVSNIFRSMGALSQGELAGERIAVAYDTKDQEDEHSCFSDNTTVDIYGNAAGVRMIYTGDYGAIEGPSLSDAVAELDPEADAALREQLDANVAMAEALQAPFDQLILGDDDAPGRVQLLELITSLQAQGDAVAALAGDLGYSISLEI
jgi:putative iron-regulated protein